MSKTDFLLNIPKPILLKLKDIDLNVPSENCNQAVNELLQRSVLLGGKRLRPLLTYIFCDFFGVDLSDERCEVCATSIEMVHAASLAHDDVIDEATMRRGSPSINIQASNKKAVLAGDYLLAAVINRLTQKGSLELVGEMSLVIQALSEGEWIQSDAIEHRQYTRELIEKIALNKTSSVMTWCGVSAALLSDLPNQEKKDQLRELTKAFGFHLGLTFQLLDDTLDFSGESQKDNLLDLKNGQVNSVIYEWLEMHPEILKDFKAGEDIMDLFTMDRIEDAIAIVRQQALEHSQKSRDLLGQMKATLQDFVPAKNLERGEKTLNFILKFLEDRKV